MVRRLVLGALAPVLLLVADAGVQARQESAPPLPGLRDRLERFVADREVAGAVALVADADGVVHLDVVGQADREADRPMTADSIFWIASMTKPLTAAAVLMLQDDGELSIDDPVAKYIPEFGSLRTPDGDPARVTIRHLLTHTAGLAEATAEQSRDKRTLAELIPVYTGQPLKFEPGSRWAYSQSGINSAGRVVEVVSGRPFADFLADRLLDPLGMTDTTFYLSEEQLPRLAISYRRTEAGDLEAAPNPILYGKAPTSRDRFPAANGGLYSTAADYARFARMLLRKGELDGRRYLSEEAVGLMSTVQTGDLTTGFTDGNGWGIGCCVVREPQGVTRPLSPGTFGHGGAHGTQAWIDPVAGRAYILMVQRANFPNADNSPVRRAFQEAAVEALVGD